MEIFYAFLDNLVPYFHVFMTLRRVKVSNEVGLSSLSLCTSRKEPAPILSVEVSDTVTAYVGRDVYGFEIDMVEWVHESL